MQHSDSGSTGPIHRSFAFREKSRQLHGSRLCSKTLHFENAIWTENMRSIDALFPAFGSVISESIRCRCNDSCSPLMQGCTADEASISFLASETKVLIRPYEGKPMVKKPLTRPAISWEDYVTLRKTGRFSISITKHFRYLKWRNPFQ